MKHAELAGVVLTHSSPLSAGGRPRDRVPRCVQPISDGCINELMFASRSQVGVGGDRLFTEFPLDSQ